MIYFPLISRLLAMFRSPTLSKLMVWHAGASTVTWTTLDPCSGLSESNSKLYTNFEFYEIEFHKHLKNI